MNALQRHRLPVLPVYSDHEFLGTAFHIGAGRFLTCRHVIEGANALFLRLVGSESPKEVSAHRFEAAGDDENSDKAWDLALLETNSAIAQKYDAVSLANQVKGLDLGALVETLAFGFPGEFSGFVREFAPRSVTVSRCDDTTGYVTDYAMADGLPSGYSGGPLLVEVANGWLCLGIMQLGGRGVARSIARASDPIVAWLQSKGVSIGGERWNPAATGVRWPVQPDAIQHYKLGLGETLSRQPIKAIGPASNVGPAGKTMLLREVYVDLDSDQPCSSVESTGRTDPDPVDDADEKPPLATSRPLPTNDSPRLSLADALALNRRAVILGLPGSGKSSFLHHVALQLIQQPDSVWPAAEFAPIPFLIELRHFEAQLTDSTETGANLLRDYLKRELEPLCAEGAWNDLERGLRMGRVAILLDGLDEVPQPRRGRVRDIIQNFSRTFPCAPMAIACRVRTYETQPECRVEGFKALEVQPFNKEKREQYAAKYYEQAAEAKLVDLGDVPTLTHTLLEAIDLRPSLQEIGSTPLMLSLMAGQHARHRLPDSRAELYDELIKEFLNDLGKVSDGGRNPILKLLDEVNIQISNLKFLLAKMAFELHERELLAKPSSTHERHGKQMYVSHDALRTALLELGDPNKSTVQWANDVIRAIEQRAGLLIAVDDDNFKFPHRSFQEFLAAVHLSRQKPFTKKARGLLFQSEHWNEVVSWACGYMVDVKEDEDRVKDLIVEIVRPETAHETPPAVPARALEVAVEIVLSVGEAKIRQCTGGGDSLGQLAKALQARMEDPEVEAKTRLRCGSALGRLGDCRPGVGTKIGKVVDGSSFEWLDIEWMPVSPGDFTMGDDESTYADEKPAWRCPLVREGFFLAKYPVTVTQYQLFLKAHPQHRSPLDYGSPFITPNHPQVGVDWSDAQAFCEWVTHGINQMNGSMRAQFRIPDGNWQARLPDEWEWEAAARGGEGRKYPWGDPGPTDSYANYGMKLGHTSPVGVFPLGAAQSGAMDMAGNVWEWCRNTRFDYGKFAQAAMQDQNRIQEPAKRHTGSPGSSYRVVRGGSWGSVPASCRCALRIVNHPGYRGRDLGFRLVLAPVPPEASGARVV